MKKYSGKAAGLGAVLLIQMVGMSAQAGQVNIPNSFSADTPAVAAEVNANFSAVKTEVDDNDSRIAALEALVAAQAATIADLQAQLATVNNSNVMALESYLTVDAVTDPRGPLVRLAGVNLQVVNGLDSTATANGLGNLIVGYDEVDNSGTARCTLGWNSTITMPVTDEPTCSAAGGSWVTTGFKTGSHYLVGGTRNNYSRWGGVLFGDSNTSNYSFASVSGGTENTASGPNSSVSGGNRNTASQIWSSVSGGNDNTANGFYSSISGGGNNTASGMSSSISGGGLNIANGSSASISGGSNNTASSWNSSISGGDSNIASGNSASISGGFTNTAIGAGSSISGGSHNNASGISASISGGGNGLVTGGNAAATDYSSILGGVGETTTVNSQTIPALP